MAQCILAGTGELRRRFLLGLVDCSKIEESCANCQIVLCFPRTDHLLPTPSIPDLPASSLPWILPQPSVFDHEFRLFPPGYAPARLCGYTAHHWTCLPAR
ncbi:unnamed protein product [Pleuronectes platessa]|uniref:Uncharacterized protein n=1 Tax=Pleuronectes platessa TaxID=8262 RepID=A0A9N7URS9_PLEPL|nr:unnamed protein product [Pleuronectes platessa]